MDEAIYKENLYRKWLGDERICKRCGACCGIKDNDPCEHLKKDPDGLYLCDIYENRFGLTKTLSGEPILCVPIRNMLHKTWWGRSQCAYVKAIKTQGITPPALT
ncbi:hypothetical protein ACFL0P_00275 [Candidatus Omnitrophota bacterium]